MNTCLRFRSVRTRAPSPGCWNGPGCSKSGQPGQKLVAPGIGGLDAERDLPEAEIRDLLAVAQLVDVDRREERHHRLGLAQARHLPEMRHQIEVAKPGEQGAPV